MVKWQHFQRQGVTESQNSHHDLHPEARVPSCHDWRCVCVCPLKVLVSKLSSIKPLGKSWGKWRSCLRTVALWKLRNSSPQLISLYLGHIYSVWWLEPPTTSTRKDQPFSSHSKIPRHIFLAALSCHPGNLCSLRHSCAPCCLLWLPSNLCPDKVPLHSFI